MDQDKTQDSGIAEKAPQGPQGGAPSTPDGANGKNKANGRKRSKLPIILGVVLVIVIAGLAYYWWSKDRISTDDAFVDGYIYPITPRVGGYVEQVLVEDNQEVKAGDVLVTLDPTEYEVAVAKAEASLAESEATLKTLELGVPLELSQTEQRVRSARAELASLRNNLAAAEGEVKAASQDLQRTTALEELAALELKRMDALLDKKVVAQADQDKVKTAFQTARAQQMAARNRLAASSNKRDALKSELDKAQAGIDLAATGNDMATIKSAQVEAQRARVKLAKAQLHQAQLNLQYTKIKSPTHGLVSKRNVEQGRVVAQGQPLMAIVPLDHKDLWITANYKETDLTRIRPGQPVSLEVDTYPGLELTGKVDSLNAGTGAAFSLFPPENATGNYVKVVQRIPVKIVLDLQQGEKLPVLRVGMSVVPTVYTDR